MFNKLNSFAGLLCGALVIFGGATTKSFAYDTKDSIFADVLLTELLNRMDNDMQAGYYDVDNEADLAASKDNVDLVSRSEYSNLCANGDGSARDCMLQSANPSLRDQEFLQHSSLWGHQYVSGGMGEGPNRYNTIVKTDASLPAYCNPPNPCPEGYEMDMEFQGNCISDFENTAIFSREFQAAQDCTCDSEHMFDCADQESGGAGGGGASSNSDMNSAVEKFLMHQFQQNDNNVLDTSNSVVKKAILPDPRFDNAIVNPFLQGDRLPIAAKKGNMLFH